MEDARQFFECDECSGEFTVETSLAMAITFCCFCGEPLDVLNFDEELEYDDVSYTHLTLPTICSL